MRNIIYVFIASLFLVSCLKESNDSVDVSTEEIIFISGERMVVTGRVLATSEIELSDHGFIISSDESFNDSERLSLGERKLPGKYVGEFTNLKIDFPYFIKSFIEFSGEIIEGDVLSTVTLLPAIDDFTPKVGFPGNEIIIQGRNLTKDAKVFIGDIEAKVISVVDESFITATIPEFQGELREEIRVVLNNTTFNLPRQFEYVVGTWENFGSFINNDNFFSHIAFRQGDEIVFGTGAVNGFGPYSRDMYSYNIVEQSWREINFTFSRLGFAFSLPGIIGSGSSMFVRHTDITYQLFDLYYKYEDGEFTFGGNAPFKLLKAHGEKIGDFGYVFGGLTEQIIYNSRIYRYNYNEDTWETDGFIPDFIQTSTDLPSFVYESDFYFIALDNNMYKYNTTNKEVVFVSEFASTLPIDAIAEVIGDKVYIGLAENRRSLMEYNFSDQTWKDKQAFISTASDRNVASWVEGGDIFVLKNRRIDEENMIIWKFSPEDF